MFAAFAISQVPLFNCESFCEEILLSWIPKFDYNKKIENLSNTLQILTGMLNILSPASHTNPQPHIT